jgi:hypothetical protein
VAVLPFDAGEVAVKTPPSASLFELDFFAPLPILVEASDAPLTSDSGLLPLRQFDERIGLTKQFAAALDDPRDPELTEHTFLEMVRSRVFGILAGYEDQNDHDALRSDPVFKLIAGRSPEEDDLASQPTLSRFENQINIASLKRLRAVFVDQFIASFERPPLSLTFDLDAVDDPTHGAQQLTLFHAFYEQYQYLPLVITCAENDQIVMISLRHGTAPASLGADDDLEYLVTRVRAAWPNVRIRVRGDGGFGNPTMYEVSERLEITYTYGLSTNAVLQRASEELLAEAVRLWDETRAPQRLFAGFWYRAGSWPAYRFVVVKAEANAQGTNRRFVVTNRAGASRFPEATYDEYVLRGESENRNKELKCGLGMDRLSDHRFAANYFRLYLHTAALNLLVRLRREIADPPPAPEGDVPAEALVGPARKHYQNARRVRDPLGKGQPATWRLLLIKAAATVIVSCRRIVVRLSGSWPYRDLFEHIGQHVSRRPAGAACWTG